MTDASGHYFLKNLPEGEFTMVVLTDEEGTESTVLFSESGEVLK